MEIFGSHCPPLQANQDAFWRRRDVTPLNSSQSYGGTEWFKILRIMRHGPKTQWLLYRNPTNRLPRRRCKPQLGGVRAAVWAIEAWMDLKTWFSSGKNMGVSKNMGTPPESSILMGFSIINHPFWGTPIFGSIHMVVFKFSMLRFWRLGNFHDWMWCLEFFFQKRAPLIGKYGGIGELNLRNSSHLESSKSRNDSESTENLWFASTNARWDYAIHRMETF